ncbi:hypothetical protein HK097_000220, partial [Rhizophlyctis rosea]
MFSQQQKLERAKRNLEKLRQKRAEAGATPTHSAIQSARASIAGSPTRIQQDGSMFSPTGSERSSFSYVSRYGPGEDISSPHVAASVDGLAGSVAGAGWNEGVTGPTNSQVLPSSPPENEVAPESPRARRRSLRIQTDPRRTSASKVSPTLERRHRTPSPDLNGQSESATLISNLTAANRTLSDRVAQLEANLAQLPAKTDEQVEVSLQQLEDLSNQLKHAEEKTNDLQTRLESSLQQNAEKDNQIAQLSEQIHSSSHTPAQATETDVSELQSKYDEVCRQLEEQTTKSSQLQITNSELQRQIDEAATKQPLSSAEGGWEVDLPADATTQVELLEVQSELEGLRGAFAALEGEKAGLEERVRELEASPRAFAETASVDTEGLQNQIVELKEQIGILTIRAEEAEKLGQTQPDLHHQISELTSASKELTQTVESLRTEAATSAAELDSTRHRVTQLTEENERMKQQYLELREKARKTVDDLNARGQAVVREREALKSQLEASKKQIGEEQARYTSLQEEFEFLHSVHAKELEEARSSSDSSVNEVREKYEASIAGLQADLATSKAEVEAARKEVEERGEAARREVGEMRREVEEAQERAREDVATLVDSMRDLTEQNGELKKDVAGVLAARAELEAEKASLEETVGSLRRDVERLGQELEVVRAEGDAKVAELEDVVRVHGEEVQGRDQRLQQKEQELEARNQQLQERDQQLQEATQQLQEKETGLLALQQDLEDTRAQWEDAEGRFESIRVRANEEIAKRQATIAELTEELAQVDAERESFYSQLAAKDEEIERLKEEHQKAILTLSFGQEEVQRMLGEGQDRVRTLEQERDQIQFQLSSISAEHESLQNEVSTLRTQKEALVSKLQHLASEKDAVVAEVTEVRASLAEAEGAIASLTEEKEFIEGAMGEQDRVLKGRIEEVTREYEERLRGVGEMQGLLARAEEEVGLLREKLVVVSGEREDGVRRVRELEEEVVRVSGQVGAFGEEKETLQIAVEALELEVEGLRKRAEGAEGKLEGVNDEKDHLRALLDLEREEKEAFVSEREGLERSVAELQQRVSTLQNELTATASGSQEALSLHQAVVRERDELQKKYDELLIETQEANDLHGMETEELHSAMGEVAARLAQLGTEKAEIERDRDHLRGRVEEFENRIVSEASHVEEVLNATRAERDAVLERERELRESLRRYEEGSRAVQEEVEGLRVAVQRGQERVVELEGYVEQLEKERKVKEDEVEALRKDVVEVSRERDDAIPRLEDLASENHALRQDLEVFSSKLEGEAAAVKAAEESKAELQRKLEHLEQQYHDSQTTVTQLTSDIESARQTMESLRSQNSDLEAALQSARDDYEAQIQEKHSSSADVISRTEKEKQALEDRVREVHTELEAIKREKDDKVRDIEIFEEAKVELQKKVEELNAALDAQRSAAADEKEAFAETMRQMEEETQEQVVDLVTTLKEVAAERDVLRGRVEDVERVLVEKDEEVGHLVEEVQRLDETLKLQSSAAEVLAIERDGLVRKLEDVEVALGKVRGDADALAVERDAVIGVRAALEVRLQDLERAEGELRKELDEAVELSERKDEEIRRLRGSVEDLSSGETARQQHLVEELERVRSALDRKSVEAESARKEIEDIVERLNRSQGATHEAAVQVETLTHRLREEHQRSSDLAVEIADLRARLDSSERAVGSVTSPVQSGFAEEGLRRRIAALEEERDSLHARLRDDARVIDELNMRIGALEGNINSLNGALAEADGHRSQLEDALQGADDEIKRFRQTAASDAGKGDVAAEYERKLLEAEERIKQYAHMSDQTLESLEAYRSDAAKSQQKLQEVESELAALKDRANKERRKSTAKNAYEADDEGAGNRRRRRESRRDGRPEGYVNGHEGQDGVHVSQDEYLALQTQVGDYRAQFENAQDLIAEHAREIEVLTEVIQNISDETLLRTQKGDYTVVAQLQRQVDEVRRAWTHEVSANRALRDMLSRTQTDAVRAQDEAAADIARLKQEFEEVVALLEAATKEADDFRIEATQGRMQADDMTRRAREIERNATEQMFEHQESMAAQEDMHGRERQALESLIKKIEKERDEVLREHSSVKRKLEEKMLEIVRRADEADLRLEDTRRNLRNAEADAARFRNEALGRLNEEAELERRALISERNKLEAALYDARIQLRSAKEREQDLLARERAAVERLERERALAADELRAAIASEQRRAREMVDAKVMEVRRSQDNHLSDTLEERSILVARVAEADEKERALLADIARLEVQLNRRDHDMASIQDANMRMRELENDIASNVDTIRDLQVQLSGMADAKNAAEAQVRAERERAKKIALKLEQSREGSGAGGGSSRRSSDTRVSGSEEVERLKKDLWRARMVSAQAVGIWKQTLEKTVGVSFEVRQDSPDLFRLKEQCRTLILEFLQLRSSVDKLSIWRADLKFQKMYLSVKIGDLQESQRISAEVFRRHHIQAPAETITERPPRGIGRLRSFVCVVIGIHRMRSMTRQWHDIIRDRNRIAIDEPIEEVRTPLTTASHDTNGYLDEAFRSTSYTTPRNNDPYGGS